MQENRRKSEVELRKFAKNPKYKYRILCARKNGEIWQMADGS